MPYLEQFDIPECSTEDEEQEGLRLQAAEPAEEILSAVAEAAADSWLRLGTFHTQVAADTADDHLLLLSSFHLRPSFYF